MTTLVALVLGLIKAVPHLHKFFRDLIELDKKQNEAEALQRRADKEDADRAAIAAAVAARGARGERVRDVSETRPAGE